MKDRNNPSNSKRTTGYCFRWFVSIAILTFLPMLAAVAKAQTDPAPAWETQAQTASVGTDASSTDVVVATSGPDNKPTYTVKTATGLAWIAWVTNEGNTHDTNSNPNDNFPASAGFEGCIVELDPNLSSSLSLALPTILNTAGNADESWVPIGSTNNKFKGTFNGNNKTITDLSITKEYTGYNAIGLFGRIENGSVNDLTVEGKIELTSYNDKTDTKHIGGIVGYSKGNINNCHNKCEINYGSVENNSSEINIGGIVGIIDNTNCSITNCSNQGKIGGTKRGHCFVGGIAGNAGSNSEAISNCFNSGEIDATAQIACVAGGIAGSNNVQLSNCYSTGAIKANVDNSSSENSCCAGGIVGNNNNKSITNCYSTGAVSATHNGKSNNSNSCSAGGIAGYSEKSTTISNCLALNNNGSPAISITATNVSTYMGRVVGKYYTGGDDATVLSNNYASTLTTMPADYTYDKGTAKKDGADIYLEDNISDILDAGISGSATSPWAYTDDKLPTLNVWTGQSEQTKPQQPTLAKATYLANKPTYTSWPAYGQTATVGTSGSDEDVTVSTTDNVVTYTVHTSKGLAWIAWVTNEGKKNSDDQGKNYPAEAGFKGCTVELAKDISLDPSAVLTTAENTDKSWVPIGHPEQNMTNYSFKGTFNGNNKTISNLSITEEYEGYYAIGLFGQIEGGSINNLTVAGEIALGSYTSSPTKFIGGIVGYSEGNINNCHNQCTIDYGNVNNNTYEINAGGIVGSIDQSGCSITNCSNQGKISGTIGGNCYVGGIAGIASNGQTLSNCFNSSEIDATAQTTCAAGGIAGQNSVTLSNCYSTGAVKAHFNNTTNNYNYCFAGGIVGYNNKNITNCYSTGTVSAIHDGSGSDLKYCYAGGIVGYSSSTTTISNCLALNKSANGSSAAISATATNGVAFKMGRVVGDYNIGAGNDTKLTGNSASTLTTMPAGYTYEKGADKKDGADIYLEGDLAAILDAGQATSPWVYTNNYLPTLKNLPGQPSQSKTAYLANKKIDPDPGNLPDNDDDTPPVYYIVTIPAVEGATTDPVAGDYEVEAWDSFGFYLTLEPAYDQSAPVVTTDRGETLSPRSSDGKYIVKYVRSDVDIAIEGITANEPPVANAVLTAGTRLWTEQQTLCIHTDTAGQLRLFTLAGSLYRTIELAPGDTRLPVPSGIYIARLNSQAIKILVP